MSWRNEYAAMVKQQERLLTEMIECWQKAKELQQKVNNFRNNLATYSHSHRFPSSPIPVGIWELLDAIDKDIALLAGDTWFRKTSECK